MFEKEVDTGIALLHERHPGWYHRIDLNSLEIARPSDCVLGQLYRSSFFDALIDLGFIGRVGSDYVFNLVNGCNPLQHGFAADLNDTFGNLTNTWKAKILELRRQDAIRDRAYYLWEEAGRPDGQADMFWCAAEQMV